MIGRILAIVVCIVFSAFFSGSEIAYNTLNENRLKQHGKNKDGALTGATAVACSIKEQFDRVLIAILVGNNLVNMGSSSLATVIAVGLMGDSGAWAATAIMTVIIITHNGALTAMADRVIRVKNGTVASVTKNEHPQNISEIEW